MKRVTLSLLSVALFAIATTSCNKKTTDPAPVSITPIQILQSHAWKFTSIKVDGDEMIEACQKDDILNFKTDGILLADNGVQKCDKGEEKTETGLYVISSDGKMLSMHGSIGTVETLNDNTLVVKMTDDDGTKIQLTFAK